MIKIFGIRHHGPGSSKSLMKALQSFHADCLLVEMPADANDVIRYIGHAELLAPTAVLIYNPKNLNQASYLPFASFSPEWQAILFANQNNIPIKLMDLPMSIGFALKEQAKNELQLQIETQKIVSPEALKMQHDPLGFLGKLAGYRDSERWWEVTFEQGRGDEEVFPLIIELMTPLREATKEYLAPEEALREAHMRKIIREAVKENYEKIAVVCGAWHAPVLDNWMNYKASADQKLLRGLKKIKTQATWIPWSYNRLATQSGYGAGVISPAWYQLLFDNREDVVIRWMSKVAQLFRAEDLDASSAHAIEGVRLADTLAALRQLSIPGIEEMKEAAVAIFCEGDDTQIALIEKQLIIGDVMGEVPKEIPVVALQKDLDACIKSARLSKERNTTKIIDKKLDLRKPANLLASHLLHRLNILGLHWGKILPSSKYETGSFSEFWKLEWQPEFAIRIIEAGMWGTTVCDAATNFAQKKADETTSLPEITLLISAVLKADLVDAIEQLVQKFQQLSALTKDVHILMETLPTLVNAIRYGTTRKLDVLSLEQVVEQMIPRICIALPRAVSQINEEVAAHLFKKLLLTNHAIGILNDPQHLKNWNATLVQIANLKNVNGLLCGVCTRLLFDKEIFDVKETATKMLFALSKGQAVLDAVNWLEGFLHGSGLLLILNQRLWNILDDWVAGLSMESLQQLLPLLRRTFSKFSSVERQKMLALAKNRNSIAKEAQLEKTGIKKERAKLALPVVKLLLDL